MVGTVLRHPYSCFHDWVHWEVVVQVAVVVAVVVAASSCSSDAAILVAILIEHPIAPGAFGFVEHFVQNAVPLREWERFACSILLDV